MVVYKLPSLINFFFVYNPLNTFDILRHRSIERILQIFGNCLHIGECSALLSRYYYRDFIGEIELLKYLGSEVRLIVLREYFGDILLKPQLTQTINGNKRPSGEECEGCEFMSGDILVNSV